MGANSLSWFVGTAAGQYVLRATKHATRAGLQAEQQVLQELSKQALPFAVPVAVPTRTGIGYVPLPAAGFYAVLARRLPGEVPRAKSPAQLYESGIALGRLVQALSHVPHPENPLRFPHYGSFADYLPPNLTPRIALASASLEAPDRQKLTALLERVEAAIPNLYRTLPHQLVHRDYVPFNVLMEDARVSAVLDFELVAEDLRALDLAVALTWWTMDSAAKGDWEGFERFGEGYRRGGGPLSEAEARAVPLLAQLRLAWGVVYALGRFLSGTDKDSWLLVFLAQRALSLEDWLVRYEEELVVRTRRWVTET